MQSVLELISRVQSVANIELVINTKRVTYKKRQLLAEALADMKIKCTEITKTTGKRCEKNAIFKRKCQTHQQYKKREST